LACAARNPRLNTGRMVMVATPDSAVPEEAQDRVSKVPKATKANSQESADDGESRPNFEAFRAWQNVSPKVSKVKTNSQESADDSAPRLNFEAFRTWQNASPRKGTKVSPRELRTFPTTSSFVSYQSYQSLVLQTELRKILQIHAEEQEAGREQNRILHRSCLGSLNTAAVRVTLDVIVGVVVLLNALFIGLSMDSSDAGAGAWFVIDVTFTVFFWLEVFLKILCRGCSQVYCGKHAFANTFDTVLIIVDTVQFFLLMWLKDAGSQVDSVGPPAMLFRLVRLARLARVSRLLRWYVFRDLLAMIQAMLGGMSTLGWSMVLLILYFYMIALVCREGLGPSSENISRPTTVERYFMNVPRSLFTVFRCSLGDCSSSEGLPIFEHVVDAHGGLWSLVLSAFLFVAVIGLFNVISALFVQSTLVSASEMAANKQRIRRENEREWAVNFVSLLQQLMPGCCSPDFDLDHMAEGMYTPDMVEEIIDAEFPCSLLNSVICDNKEAVKALQNLDVDPADYTNLSDILDPYNRGFIGVLTLVDGLKGVRGNPRRSDIITVDLMVRSVQEKLDVVCQWTRDIVEAAGNPHKPDLCV